MTVRYTQASEPFKQRRINGMKFGRSATATTKKEAQSEADKMRGKGILVRVVPENYRDGHVYALYTR